MNGADSATRCRPAGRIAAAVSGLLGLMVTTLVTVSALTTPAASAATAGGAWTVTGSMTTGRDVATATRLPNGQVLEAGGYGPSGVLASAELYNPATGTWQATGPMTTPRAGATATLLPNGEVLEAGGYGTTGVLASAELYNPATGTWQATGLMTTPRAGATATLLPNGEVLEAGGYGTTGVLASAELYNPATGTWQATGPMSTMRAGATATLLPNGTVLEAGGTNPTTTPNAPPNTLASVEIYNPATQLWQSTPNMTEAHWAATASLLPDGDVLVAGGGLYLGGACSGCYVVQGIPGADLYDPVAGTWQAAAPMNVGRYDAAAVTLSDGAVLETGGLSGSWLNAIASTEQYEPTSAAWSIAPGSTGDMNQARQLHTATTLANGTVLVTGGDLTISGAGTAGALASAEIFDPNGTPAGPQITVSPTSLTFGPILGGTTSPPQTVTVTNPGSAPLVITGAVINSQDFTVSLGACATVNPGTSCSFPLTFSPGLFENGGPNTILSIQDNSPAGSVVVPVTGTSLARIPGSPTVTGVTPNNGPVSGGTPVTITGANLTGGTVYFGNAPSAQGIPISEALNSSCSATSCTAITPGSWGRGGTVYIYVFAPDGADNYAPGSPTFTYEGSGTPAVPVVTGITPNSGPAAGGSLVTITGTNLTGGAASAAFGSGLATNLTCASSTLCTATTPPGTGTVQVLFDANGGEATSTSKSDQFTYATAPPAHPAISSISPSSGAAAGGTVVSIHGTNVSKGIVFFGSAPATTSSCTTASACSATAPAGAGPLDVRVTTTGGTSPVSAADQFTYPTPAPAITGVSPASGAPTGGTLVLISGVNLSAANVAFGSTPAASAACDAFYCEAISPPGSGTVDVTATTRGGISSTSGADQFSYQVPPPAPVVTGISPSGGPAAGGTVVTVSGSNLTGGSVSFGGVAATNVSCSPSSCTATTPANSYTVGVTVTTAGGTSAVTSAEYYAYQLPSPAVTGLSPSGGPATGGTTVTITGTNLLDANLAVAGINFGTAPASIVGCTAIFCTVTAPPGTGTVDVTVTNSTGGTSPATPADRYTYAAAPPLAPTVTGVTPGNGPAAGGTTVTVTGTNLTGATVAFGTAAATAVTCSATSCSVTSPPGSGKVDVTATTPGGTSATSAGDKFTYAAAPPPVPTVTGIAPSSGPAGGGTAVTVSGSNLSGGTVSFGASAATAVTCTASTCSATAPPGSGTVDVRITTSGGTSATTTTDRYSYQTGSAPANLITNPGFESAGVPADDWGSSVVRSPAVVHSGSWSLAQTATSTSGGWDLDSNVAWCAPISSAKTYTATVWVQATAAITVDLNVDLLNASGSYINSVDGPNVKLTPNTWTPLTITGLKATTAEVLGAPEPNFSKATKGTVIYWDDMSLTSP